MRNPTEASRLENVDNKPEFTFLGSMYLAATAHKFVTEIVKRYIKKCETIEF